MELSLPFSLKNNKGAIALLLGSGVSSAAGIPTGWGITVDLIRKIAAATGKNAEPNPEVWFTTTFGKAPDYSDLLDVLAPTTSERQRLLRHYFIPTQEEREQNLKVPTKAHQAIAELTAKGYFKVILTTNFDPLLEQALEKAGVQPIIVSDTAAISGMLPLQHAQVTIIKLHGHYLDTRLKNTQMELSQYDPELNQLLDRIFDEYGLLICGWSGIWDIALREAILRCPSRRFTTYWTTLGELAEEAKVLATHRQALILRISSADSFCQELAETITALEDLDKPNPLTTAVAVATLKRLLPLEEHRIRLHDLVFREVEAVWENVSQNIPSIRPTPEIVAEAIFAIDKQCERLLQLLATGSYWSAASQHQLWLKVVERLSIIKHGSQSGGYSTWSDLRLYPLLLSYYAIGIGAVAAGKTEFLLDLLLKPKFRKESKGQAVSPSGILFEPINKDEAKGLWPENRRTPVSDHVNRVMQPIFHELIPDDAAFEDIYDRFECIMALVFYDSLKNSGSRYAGYFMHGRYLWRGSGWSNQNDAVEEIKNEIATEKEEWPLLKRGLYNCSLVEINQALGVLDTTISQFHRYR